MESYFLFYRPKESCKAILRPIFLSCVDDAADSARGARNGADGEPPHHHGTHAKDLHARQGNPCWMNT